VKRYRVSELANLAGVSVKTLHHYDQLGLLSPSARSETGYRLYGQRELLLLQQILFYRQLSVPLAEIQNILHNPEFDLVRALRQHRVQLQEQQQQLTTMLTTLDKTLRHLEDETMHPLTDEELYQGFATDEVESVRQEAESLYGEQFFQVENKLRQLGRDDWQTIKEEGEAIAKQAAELAHAETSETTQLALAARHHAWVEHFYTANADIYRGLAEMYLADKRFQQFYDRQGPGTAAFLSAAMRLFADRNLK